MNANLNRRDFLKAGGGALAVGALLPGGLLADEAPAKPKRTLKKAIMLATVGGKMSLMDKFKLIKECGFAGVEPMGSMDRQEVLAARDAAGLVIPSVCDAVHWAKPLSDPKSVRPRN